MIRTLTIALIATVTGCTPLLSERKASEAVRSSEAVAASHETTIKRTFESVPELASAVQQSGTGVVSVPLAVRETLEVRDTTDHSAGSRATAQGSSITSLPMGTKLILLAIGGFLLLALVWAIRRSSVAANAAYKAGDAALGNVISHVGSMAATSTNPEQLNLLNSLRAEIERARGKAKGGT